MKKLLWENQHLFWIMYILGLHFQKLWNTQRCCGKLQIHVWIANFHFWELKNFYIRGIFVFLSWSNEMENHAKKCVVRYCELANKTTQQLFKVFTPCIDDDLKRKSWNPLGNCQKFVFKLFWNACTWHVLENVTFCGQGTNLQDRLKNGPGSETNAWIAWYVTFITSEFKQYCYLKNTAKQSRLGLFQDLRFCGEILRTQSLLKGEHCTFREVIHLFQ